MDFIRFWLGFFRGRHRNLGKMRNPADGFSCGHGGSHRGGVAFSWIMVFLVGSQGDIPAVDAKTWAFLVLSGLATGASWLCYFRALQLGDINKVVPIDKSSTVLTMVLAFLFLQEGLTWLKAASMAAIAAGTYLMIQKKATEQEKTGRRAWLLYALLSAVFASLTAILGKVGIEGVESNLGTAIRTGVVW